MFCKQCLCYIQLKAGRTISCTKYYTPLHVFMLKAQSVADVRAMNAIYLNTDLVVSLFETALTMPWLKLSASRL